MCGFRPLWITSAGFSFSFFLSPADKTCRQQCTSLTDRVPCSQQGNSGIHNSHTLLTTCSVEKPSVYSRQRVKNLGRFSKDPPTHPCLMFFLLFQSRKESTKPMIVYIKTCFWFLLTWSEIISVLRSDIKKWKDLIEYKFEFLLSCMPLYHSFSKYFCILTVCQALFCT